MLREGRVAWLRQEEEQPWKALAPDRVGAEVISSQELMGSEGEGPDAAAGVNLAQRDASVGGSDEEVWDEVNEEQAGALAPNEWLILPFVDAAGDGIFQGFEEEEEEEEEEKPMYVEVNVADSSAELVKSVPINPREGRTFLKFCRTVGQGSFGAVLLAVDPQEVKELAENDTGVSSKADTFARPCAVKIIPKERISSEQEALQMAMELRALKLFSHPFISSFQFAFHTADSLFIGLEFCSGGELFSLMRAYECLEPDEVRFYTAEIALALDHIHSHRILYRDLKPENICLSGDGHVRLVDFGMVIELKEENYNEESKRQEVVTHSGTLAYTAPEILQRRPHSFEADWWSLGVLMYEMLFGELPWFDDDSDILCSMICSEPLPLPSLDHDQLPAYQLIAHLLKKEQEHRVGYHGDGLQHIKCSSFMQKMNWEKLANSEPEPPFIPELESVLDVSNFDVAFTQQNLNSFLTASEESMKLDDSSLAQFLGVHQTSR